MPTEAFHWVDYTDQILQTPADADHGYILEVDLEYSASLHAPQNDYPLAPEKMAVTKGMISPYRQKLVEDLELGAASFNCEKLAPNLMPKQRYVLHCRNLQLYRQLGMEIVKVRKASNSISLLEWPPIFTRTHNSGQPPPTISKKVSTS